MIRWLLLALALLSGVVFVLGFGGRFHGAGDVLAIGRPLVVLALVTVSVLLIPTRSWRAGGASFCLALLGGGSMVPPAFLAEVPGGARPYALYQKNLLFRLKDTAPVAEDILASGADFVALQELHARNRPLLDVLNKVYPHQQFCPITQVGGTAVLSRWPATGAAPMCDEEGEWAAMQVETPDGPLWLVSVHLEWPYPYSQFAQVQRILPKLDALDGAVVVGGDFNMVAWSHTLSEFQRVTGTRSAGYAGGTFDFRYRWRGHNIAAWMRFMPIDHVLVPDRGGPLSLQRQPLLGSDHHGLLASFVMTRE